MKKLIVILLLLGYGFSSIGMTLHVHFCCGRVDTVKLVPVNDHECPADKNEKKGGCCDDRQLELKIKTDYKNESSNQLKIKNFEDVFILHRQSIPSIANANSLPVHKNFIYPPPEPANRLYKTNCIFRI